MPKVLVYNEMDVAILRATDNPAILTGLSLDTTMRKHPDYKPVSQKTCKFLLDAEHTSVLEHINYTFLIRNVSRSFLAQITRHRMCSFTAASQHYQDYTDYPCVVSRELLAEPLAHGLFEASYDCYMRAQKNGITKEEARQVLPNAAAVNIIWTINARSLTNFLKLRLCKRNVTEMQMFAENVLRLVKHHFSELFNNVGPQCFMDKCKQGKMKCMEGSWR